MSSVIFIGDTVFELCEFNEKKNIMGKCVNLSVADLLR